MSAKPHGSGVLAPLFIWDRTDSELGQNAERGSMSIILLCTFGERTGRIAYGPSKCQKSLQPRFSVELPLWQNA